MARAKTPVHQQRPHCALSIDHCTYLLPFAAGQKVMELLASAIRAERDFDRDERSNFRELYRVRETGAVKLELHLVQPDQVVMPRATQAMPEPLKRIGAA